METQEFTMTRKIIINHVAEKVGMMAGGRPYCTAAFTFETAVYCVYQNGTLIKTHNSSDSDKMVNAFILLRPNTDNIVSDIFFSNKNKRKPLGGPFKPFIMVSATTI